MPLIAGNVLTNNQQDFESAINTSTEWTNRSNVTPSSSTVQFNTLTHSMLLTPSAAGDIQATTPGTTVTTQGLWVLSAFVRSGISVRGAQLFIEAYDPSFVPVSPANTVGLSVNTTTSSWTNLSLSWAVPPKTGILVAGIWITGCSGVTDVHYVDTVSLISYPTPTRTGWW